MSRYADEQHRSEFVGTRLTKDTNDRLRDAAWRKRMSIAEVLREAIEEWLDQAEEVAS